MFGKSTRYLLKKEEKKEPKRVISTQWIRQLSSKQKFNHRYYTFSFLLNQPPSQQPAQFRRHSCHCNCCGQMGKFQERQSVLYPQTYINAHMISKRKKKRVKKPQKVQSASPLKLDPQSNKKRNNRKHQTTFSNFVKNNPFKSKDDNEINYEFFYQNELRLERLIQHRLETMKMLSYRSICDSQYSSSEQEIQIMPIITEKTPIKKKKIVMSHSRKTTEYIIQQKNLNPNKTILKYTASKTFHSPRELPPISSPHQSSKTHRKSCYFQKAYSPLRSSLPQKLTKLIH
ncbi:hypothetical protein pb186bvf_019559 [Paramecium bursaria]